MLFPPSLAHLRLPYTMSEPRVYMDRLLRSREGNGVSRMVAR